MPIPSLLVSVRNLDEALAAVRGGCDLLDAKEPSRGPLGMPDQAVIAEIAALAQSAGGGSSIPCSVALGEIDQWLDSGASLSFPPGVTHVKLGPARLDARQRWRDGWRHARDRLNRTPALRLVAAAYADWSTARALPPRLILESAIESACDAFLIDTYDKGLDGLVEMVGLGELKALCREARQARVTLALAGSIGIEQLPAIRELDPDIIGVRGAACEGRRRLATISADSVWRLKSAIADVFA